MMPHTKAEVPAQRKKPVRFRASLNFSHGTPYDPLFVERVPVLQAFALALANYHRLLVKQRSRLRGRVKQLVDSGSTAFCAVECGVFTGSSLLACAGMARDAGVNFRLVGLDTFEGLPTLSETDRSLSPEGATYLTKTLFTDTSLESVQDKITKRGFGGSVELRKGLFSATLPTLPEQKYHFVNIDCDLYEPHLECLEYFYPRMMPGAIVFFDDYHSVEYPMAGRAVDDFMRDKPEQLMHLRFGEDGPNRTKSFFVKY